LNLLLSILYTASLYIKVFLPVHRLTLTDVYNSMLCGQCIMCTLDFAL